MDIIVMVILLVMYLVWQALTGATSQQKPRPSSRGQSETKERPRVERADADSELERALREIREAMGVPAEARTQQDARPEQSPRRVPSPQSTSAERYRARQEELRREQQQLEQETRRFEQEREATMDQQLERQRTLMRRVAAAERRTSAEKITEKPLEVETDIRPAATDRRSRWIGRLYQSDSAQEAVVLSEVLGPPRARTRQRVRR